MTLYAGMKIGLKVRGTDGFTLGIITDAACVINLYGPGKDPVHSPVDRAHPDHTVGALYNSVDRYYEATVDSTGWTPGTWTMQGVLSGGANGYQAFDFETFTLAA